MCSGRSTFLCLMCWKCLRHLLSAVCAWVFCCFFLNHIEGSEFDVVQIFFQLLLYQLGILCPAEFHNSFCNHNYIIPSSCLRGLTSSLLDLAVYIMLSEPWVLWVNYGNICSSSSIPLFPNAYLINNVCKGFFCSEIEESICQDTGSRRRYAREDNPVAKSGFGGPDQDI